jgi:hypothetical protein
MSGFLRMWKSSVERGGFTSQQVIPFHRVLMALFASQGLLPFMRQYSWTEWQDGDVLFSSGCWKSFLTTVNALLRVFFPPLERCEAESTWYYLSYHTSPG